MPDLAYFWMHNWVLEPSIIVGLLAIYGGYLYLTVRLQARWTASRPLAAGQFAAFTCGILVLVIALLSPLDRLSDEYLFSAHMVQHVLLTLVAPPLLILGTPGWLFEPLRRHSRLLGLARLSTNPYFGFIAFNAAFSIWHVPVLYEGALQSEPVHVVEHLSFIATAVMTWMPVLSPTPLLPRLAPPVQVLYLFLQSLPPTVLGAVICFAEQRLYPFYGDAGRLWGLSIMDDQMYAGLIMWVGGALIWLLALTIVFFNWFNRQEQVDGKEFI